MGMPDHPSSESVTTMVTLSVTPIESSGSEDSCATVVVVESDRIAVAGGESVVVVTMLVVVGADD